MQWAYIGGLRRTGTGQPQLAPADAAAVQWRLLRLQVSFNMEVIADRATRAGAHMMDIRWQLRRIGHHVVTALIETVDMVLTTTESLLLILVLLTLDLPRVLRPRWWARPAAQEATGTDQPHWHEPKSTG